MVVQERNMMNTPTPILAGMCVPQVAKSPVDVQPKLDGLRCLVSADDLVLRSRGGKNYCLPHIAEHLALILAAGAIAGGEIYIHGVPLQALVSLAGLSATSVLILSPASPPSRPSGRNSA